MGPESLPVHNLLGESHAGTTGAAFSHWGSRQISGETLGFSHDEDTTLLCFIPRPKTGGSNPHRLHPHGLDPKTRGGPPTLRFTYHAGPACAIHAPHFLGRLFRLHARKCLSLEVTGETWGPHTFHSQRDRPGRVRSRTPSLSNRQVGRYPSHPAPHWGHASAVERLANPDPPSWTCCLRAVCDVCE
jgi:hypothetical protein